MPNTVNSYIETDLGNVSPNPRGEYNATYDYEYLDLIYYKGGSYLCLAPLGETIKNVPPIVGQTTTNWQCVAIPGDLTPEYISMYNEVVKDYNETNTNTADVAQMKDITYASMTAAQESESKASTSETNARNSEVNAKQSMDKAKEYSDEAIRVNNDTQSLVTGFDEHVATAISNAEASISESTDNAKGEIVAQKSSSLNEFRTDAETVMTNEKNVAVAEIHQMVDDFSADADSKKQEVIQVADEKINAMTALKNDAVNAKNAAETAATTAVEKASETATYAGEAKSSSDSAKANADLVSANKIEIDNAKSDVDAKVEQFESDLETYSVRTLRSDMTELQKKTSDGFSALKSDLGQLEISEYLYKREDGKENYTGEIWNLEKNKMYSITTIPKNTFIKGLYVKSNKVGKIKISIGTCRAVSNTSGYYSQIFTENYDVKKSDYNYIPVNKIISKEKDVVVFIGYIDMAMPVLLPQKENSAMESLKEFTLSSDTMFETPVEYSTGVNKYGIIADVIIKSLYLSQVSAKQFGCIGDGTHDDTDALQRAIDFASRNNTKLFIENGKYKISKTLKINNSVKIVGESFSPVYGLWTESFGKPLLLIDAENFNGNDVIKSVDSRVEIENLYILNVSLTGTNKHTPTISGLTLEKGVSYINNLAICGFKYGLHSMIQSISNFNNIYISACIVCFYNEYTSDSVYNNLYLNTNHFMLDYISYDVSTNNPSVIGFYMLGGNNTITNGKIEYLGTGLVLNGSANISGIIFDSCYKNAIYINEDSTEFFYIINIIKNLFLGGHQGNEHILFKKKRLSCNINGNIFAKSSGNANAYTGNYPDTLISAYCDNKNETSVVLFTNNIAHDGSASRPYNLTNCYKFISKDNTITPSDNSYVYQTDLIEDGNITINLIN